MYGLEYMTDGDINNEISNSLASPSTFFPSLERFYLENCPNLKGWWRRDIVVDKGKEATATSTIPLPSFPRLSFFSFWDCPKMTTWMPLFPNLEGLYMINTSWKPLEQTIEMKTMNTASSFPSSSSSPLSKLKDLYLREMQDLESLPEEWLKSLTSLKRLEIWENHRDLSQAWARKDGEAHLATLGKRSEGRRLQEGNHCDCGMYCRRRWRRHYGFRANGWARRRYQVELINKSCLECGNYITWILFLVFM